MESFFHDILNYVVTAMGCILAWVWSNLKEKATKEELNEVKGELKELRTKVYETLQNLATKDDINRLNEKLDRIAEKSYEERRNK